MPTFEIKTAEGATYRVTAPDEGAAMRALQSMQGGGQQAQQRPESFSFGEAATRMAGQGFMAGLRDEASAMSAAAPEVMHAGRGLTPEQQERFRRVTPGFDAVSTIVGGANMLAEKLAPSIFGTEGLDRYEETLQSQRGLDAQARDEQKLGSLVGTIGGAMLNPLARVMPAPSANAGARFLRGGMAAVPYSAAIGFGEGEGGAWNRAQNAAWAGTAGFLTGGALNSAIGRRTTTPTGGVSDVTRASDRQGVRTPVVAATDSAGVQRTGMHLRNASVLGNPIMQGMDRATDDLGMAAARTAQRMGGEGMEGGGEVARSGIASWITGRSRDVTRQAYDAVDSHVDNAVRTRLENTRRIATDIIGERQAAALRNTEGRAVSEVFDAITRRDGLSYEGIKKLRTSIGEMMDNGVLPADISRAELNRVYGALSDDLRMSVSQAGGPRAVSLFERANRLNTMVQGRRERLATVVGAGADASPAQVFQRLVAAAQSKGRADTRLLYEARRAMGPEEWREFGGSYVGLMGRDGNGAFSPQRFMTEWGKLSDRGKQIMFDVAGNRDTRQALDDIATISQRFVDMQQRYGNPSGTAQSLSTLLVGGAMMADPLTTLGAGIGTNLMSRALAQPATARAMARWSRSYESAFLRGQTPAAGAMQAETRALASTIGQAFGINPAQLAESLASQMQGNAQPGGGEVPPVGQQQPQAGQR